MVTIVYDNTSTAKELIADWGFACVIETGKKIILFDTGGNGEILLQNLANLNINPHHFTDIVISHPDYDHIGGLSYILNLNHHAVVHNPISFRGVKFKNEVKYYDKPTEIDKDIILTGELAHREQSLAIKTKHGLVLLIGCGHPTLRKIFDSIAPFGDVYAIVGGLHGFQEYELLKQIEKICPTHCTINQEKIKQLYPEKFLEGGVGRKISL